uniref:Ribonuclease P protein subunit p29 n=1 Tax=Elaeophora elaphi TaxID=1147741 RepID=A0A0R3RGT1_9BILA
MNTGPSTSFEPLNPHKIFILEKRIKKKVKIHRQPMENFTKRRITKSDLKDLKYSQFEPLYELWCDYFSTLVEGSGGQLDARVLKADYHGCLLMVAEAANPSQAGLCGIVTRETRQTFILITKQDRLLTIPKQDTIFQFALGGKIYILFGNAFRFQPSLRAKKILRTRSSIPLFLK